MTHDASVAYGPAIRDGFAHLLARHPETFAIGQGLWSPWYVGNSMTNLDAEFGKERVIDTPVSEAACTSAALGAALSGRRPIVIHPRVDFFILAMDAVVNQAAKWNHMFGGGIPVPVVFRAIINRGGEQGAQHSQSLASWFAHVPGLRVVMPSTPRDARELLVAAALGKDPVVYVDDRWCYERTERLGPVEEWDIAAQGPAVRCRGDDVTIVSYSFCAWQCEQAADALAAQGVFAEVIDLRVINPLDLRTVFESVARTGRLLCVDGDWAACGVAGEVISQCAEAGLLRSSTPRRLALPPAPAPTSGRLEQDYYLSVEDIVDAAMSMVAGAGREARC
jgi:pyruvate/2-oxoglutarate/acetoin dehydrogenase E1 component